MANLPGYMIRMGTKSNCGSLRWANKTWACEPGTVRLNRNNTSGKPAKKAKDDAFFLAGRINCCKFKKI